MLFLIYNLKIQPFEFCTIVIFPPILIDNILHTYDFKSNWFDLIDD